MSIPLLFSGSRSPFYRNLCFHRSHGYFFPSTSVISGSTLYSEFSVFTLLMHASVCEFQLDEHVEGHVRVSSSSDPHRATA